MRLAESARFAVTGIVANKMRAALTMLGILVGVASVITLVAVGTGSSRDVQKSISRLGSNTLFVLPLQDGGGGQGRGIGGPGVLMQRVQATHGTSSHTVNLLIGTTPVFLSIDNSSITCGPGFTEED